MVIQDREMDETFWHKFWRDFPAAADYFSPAVVGLQQYLGVGSKEILYSLGEMFGRKVAEKFSDLDVEGTISELSSLWERMDIGRLEIVSRNPLTLMVYNCVICGQLAGTGAMYECGFHEGFFQSVISNSLMKKVNLHQDTNFEGEAPGAGNS